MYTSSFTVQEGKVIVHLTKNLMNTLGIYICTCMQCTQSSYPIKSNFIVYTYIFKVWYVTNFIVYIFIFKVGYVI